MPTPAIQTLINDAQQVLNLDSISAVRSVVAVSLANANTGTPLNPNLTTQQLWNEFYQVVTRSKSDIESIIANQLMKFLYSPPAPGGVGANGQVIFNNNGVLAGDNELFYNATTNTLTTEKLIVPGNTQVAGSLSNLYVGSILNPTLFANTNTKLVGIGTASPTEALHINRSSGAGVFIRLQDNANTNYIGTDSGNFRVINNASQDILNIQQLGVFTFGDGAGGTRMTLNSTGLGVGTASHSRKLEVHGTPSTIGGTATGMLVTVANSGTAYNASPTSGLALWNKFNSSGNLFPSAAIQAGKENATDGNYAGFLSLYTVNSVGSPNEQMRIDSSGNVGIGVTSPTSQLTVGSGGTANPAATVAFHKSTSDEYRLKLTSSTFNAAGKWIGLGLGYSSDYMKMAIIAEAKDSNARGNLYFALNNDATSANASIADAKMTLKSTGQVRFVPLSADPAGAEAGDVYYNSTSNKLKCYNGTTWNDLF